MRKIYEIFIAFVLVAVAGTFQGAAAAAPGDYADWMAQNSSMLQDFTINNVVLPGSHNAASCDIRDGSKPVTGYVTEQGGRVRRNAGAGDVDAATCQSGTITEQLMNGVRYFDICVTHQDNRYWACNIWVSTPLLGSSGVLHQIWNYVNAHPDEVIILNFREAYSARGPMTKRELSNFYYLVEQYFDEQLIPRGEFDRITLADIWKGSGRIIVIGDVTADNTDRGIIWDERKVDSKQLNAQSIGSLFEMLQKQVLDDWQRGADKDDLRVLQAMQSTGYKLFDAAGTNAVLMMKLKGSWRNYPLNVIQVDDSAESGLMPAIIALNSRRAENHL